MAYILFINPQILAQAGLPADEVAFATAASAAIATLVMGLAANYPFALAPGMGLNAYFTFGVVLGMGIDWKVALTAVFIEGFLFLALSLGGVRAAVIDALPDTLKISTMAGIGLFLAIIGFQNAGLVVDHPATLITLGSLSEGRVLIALGGLLLIGGLFARRFPGAILIGILAATALGWLTGLAPLPTGVFAVPTVPTETLLAFDFDAVVSGKIIGVVLAFLFVDFFDTAGTLIGVGRLGGFLDEEGSLPNGNRAFAADAIGTTVGAALGTSSVTTYIESATGIEEGGRTGLTAVVTATLFAASLFFIPLVTAIPGFATAPALIVVGALMMRGTRDIPWERFDEALPAFLVLSGMAFTYSIATGIALGIVSWLALKVVTGQWRAAHPVMYGLAGLLVLYYGTIG